MDNNRKKEFMIQRKYHEGWNLSKKYASILILHEGDDDYFSIALNIYHQFISELKLKKIPHQEKNYVQIWETMTNTIMNNPKVNVSRAAIKLLHQTSVQRSK